MDRRHFLAAGTATAALAALPFSRALAQTASPGAAAPAAAPGDAKLTAAFDRVLAQTVANSPEFATSLGFDKGTNAHLRHELSDNGPGALAKDLALYKRMRGEVAAVSPDTLSPQAKIDREVVLYNINSQIVGPERFGLGSPQGPYPISQQDLSLIHI